MLRSAGFFLWADFCRRRCVCLTCCITRIPAPEALPRRALCRDFFRAWGVRGLLDRLWRVESVLPACSRGRRRHFPGRTFSGQALCGWCCRFRSPRIPGRCRRHESGSCRQESNLPDASTGWHSESLSALPASAPEPPAAVCRRVRIPSSSSSCKALARNGRRNGRRKEMGIIAFYSITTTRFSCLGLLTGCTPLI